MAEWSALGPSASASEASCLVNWAHTWPWTAELCRRIRRHPAQCQAHGHAIWPTLVMEVRDLWWGFGPWESSLAHNMVFFSQLLANIF